MTRTERAYLAPFGLILAGLLLVGLVQKLFDGQAHWAMATPQYWVFPLQTLVAGAVLWSCRRYYHLQAPARAAEGVAMGVFVLAVWLLPRALGAAPRLEGWDPSLFTHPVAYGGSLFLRFVRLVVVVPFAEEIFWRGYLARYLVNSDFEKVPFGTFTLPSFFITTAGFCVEHSLPDWPAAFATGALYNLLAWRTRSLSTCVLAHAVTNLLLGVYVLRTGEWGYW